MNAHPLVDMDRVLATNSKTLIRAYAAIPEIRIEAVEAARLAFQLTTMHWLSELGEIHRRIAAEGLNAEQACELFEEITARMLSHAEGFVVGTDDALALSVDIAHEAAESLMAVVDTSIVSLNAAQHALLRPPANASNA